MDTLETFVLIGVLLILGAIVAPKLRMPVPLLLLILGILVGFIPPAREIHLPAEVVLVLFLPVLLYWEAATTSLRDIRRDLRGILLLSTVLVGATAFGVAGLGVALGMSWGSALILGAALAPTDATAVGTMARTLPHRNMTVLRAESLINDGTALVLYSIATGVAIGNVAYTGWDITWIVFISYVGGGLLGVVAAWLGTLILRLLSDSLVINVVLLVIPFIAFLAAELINASGVIAVVVAGLVITHSGPRVSTPASRQQTHAFWSLSTFVLNGALSVLIGIQAQSAVRAVNPSDIWPLILLTIVAWISIMLIRLVFQITSAFLIRLLDRRPSQLAKRMPHRARVVSAVAGFRGAVSLAVALSVPATFATGAAFPGRDQIIFVAAGVVLLTLLAQGLLLRPVLRWANLPEDRSEAEELATAQRTIAVAAANTVADIAGSLKTSAPVRERVLAEYGARLTAMNDLPDDTRAQSASTQDREYTALLLAILEHKRAALLMLRDQQAISSTNLLTMQARLDREALRLTQPDILE